MLRLNCLSLGNACRKQRRVGPGAAPHRPFRADHLVVATTISSRGWHTSKQRRDGSKGMARYLVLARKERAQHKMPPLSGWSEGLRRKLNAKKVPLWE